MQSAQVISAAGTAPANADNFRSDREFQRARQHSAMVRFLRRALPIAAIILSLGFLSQAMLAFGPTERQTLTAGDFDGTRLVMNSPKLSGFNQHDLPYDVTAARAIQDANKPNIVDLEEIFAEIPMRDNSRAKIWADLGTFRSKRERLVLKQKIEVRGSNGMELDLEEAEINMRKGTLVSNKPVTVRSERATITARSILVKDDGDTIIFKDRVQMTIAAGALKREEKKQ